jgi:hypothetical protein
MNITTTKLLAPIGVGLFALGLAACSPRTTVAPTDEEPDSAWVARGINTAVAQLTMMADSIESRCGEGDSALFPRSIWNPKPMAERNPQNWLDSVRLTNIYDWTSGFFPGELWLAYELTGDTTLADRARRFTDRLAPLQDYTGTHDLGFMVFCSYGNALRLRPEAGDSLVIINTSRSLASRYDAARGVIRSWDFGSWTYPVIIDNMMNLEMLFWAEKQTGDSTYYNICTSHADNTLRHQYRQDMSCCHVADYVDPQTDDVRQYTFQGYSDSSAWARGQAWGLYGYTVCYRETGLPQYLQRAQEVAAFIMNHPRTPDDAVPYWDYDDPAIPDAPRDASAAAVTASALLELYNLTNQTEQTYFDYARRILRSLSSDEYLAAPGSNNGFILKHSTGSLPHGSEVDVPLVYADYYYLEALGRYRELISNNPSL